MDKMLVTKIWLWITIINMYTNQYDNKIVLLHCTYYVYMYLHVHWDLKTMQLRDCVMRSIHSGVL